MSKCPQCGGRLTRVVQTSGWLNQDQFDAAKAGDWFCENCPDNGRGKSGLCYWWNSEVEAHEKKLCDATQGPWTTDDGDSHCYGIFGADGDAVAYCSANANRGEGLRGAEEDRANAIVMAAAPELFHACESVLAWLTNCNVSDPATLAREIMAALQKAGADKQALDEAAVAIVRGPCSVPNLIGED